MALNQCGNPKTALITEDETSDDQIVDDVDESDEFSETLRETLSRLGYRRAPLFEKNNEFEALWKIVKGKTKASPEEIEKAKERAFRLSVETSIVDEEISGKCLELREKYETELRNKFDELVLMPEFSVFRKIAGRLAFISIGFGLRTLGTYAYLTDNDKNYLSIIRRKSKQLIYTDEYGDVQEGEFENELRKFFNSRKSWEIDLKISETVSDDIFSLSVEWGRATSSIFCDCFVPELSYSVYFVGGGWGVSGSYKEQEEISFDMFRMSVKYILRAIEENNQDVKELAGTEKFALLQQEKGSPLCNYEEYIGRKFEILGWQSQVIKGSGDQGADVIIEKGAHRGIVQCRMHSQPIGNKFIQEIYSAKNFYNGTFALAISNPEYTLSARMLATKLGVYLIHDSEIRDFSELFN